MPVLVGGVGYAGSVPRLDTSDGGLPLTAGARVGWRVVDPARHCLGRAEIDVGEAAVRILPCPDKAQAKRGDQCLSCFFADEFRPIHDAHRGGDVPEALRHYLAREHWLYIATFAHGASKVGTTSDASKFTRLAEQGAVAAQYEFIHFFQIQFVGIQLLA